jgi:hypothetical protein
LQTDDLGQTKDVVVFMEKIPFGFQDKGIGSSPMIPPDLLNALI